jgi:hypothetical protein
LAPRPSAAAAGQEAALTGTIIHDVFGNGDPDNDYDAPPPGGDPLYLTLTPDGNAVRAVGDVTVYDNIYGGAWVSSSDATARENWVIAADGGSLSAGGTGTIYAGYAYAYYGAAQANGNRVIADGGAISAPVGGVYGGFAVGYDSAVAFNNRVEISDDATLWKVLGGEARSRATAPPPLPLTSSP